MTQNSFKVAIVGCGSVGATTAYGYLLSGTVDELTLIDVDRGKAEGLFLDLQHALSFTPYVKLDHGDSMEKCEGANLVVITAGKRQEKGETRLELVEANKRIFEKIIPEIVSVAKDALLMIVSNPVDVLTYHAQKLSGLPSGRVFGSGTTLDSARLQLHLSGKLGVHPESIDAYVLGEHGDTSFPVYSSANVIGKALTTFPQVDEAVLDEAYGDTKNAAYRIIHDQGYTCYSIATVIRELTEAIIKNKHKVFPLSVLLDGDYGHKDVCLSVPCILGRNGIEGILEVPLNEVEKKQLKKSVETLKAFN
ncbi:L-lactate dehydrogenase [Candidatus Peregrinibacteria bacterium HGW-Peregrinibacteria-1]|jgi:L-lactate dehydrogenase|nr:MAG: L-lactate dehydrogenase [Candidatus Peregrinibacteria bacterium HGW-Peregrinibacteria-1]